MRNEGPIALSAKRNHTAAALRLENSLLKQICAQNSSKVALTGELAIMQAVKLPALANSHLFDNGEASVISPSG